jgi:hypothetical protein
MGATGIEPMTSTVSMDCGWSILLIRLGSLCSILVHFARYSPLIVPKLFPSFPSNWLEARVVHWLCYRCFVSKGQEAIPLFGLYGLAHQLGSVEYSRPRRFRAMLEQWLGVVRALWPECPARINADGGTLKIDRGTPVLPPKLLAQIPP